MNPDELTAIDKGDMYQCARCKRWFVAGTAAADCWDEALDTFPADKIAEGVGSVCDPCYHAVIAWARVHAPDELRPTSE